MSQQHRRNNLTKIERMNQINRFSRVAETKLESIINVSQRSSPSRGMGTNSFRQKRQTLAKPQRIAKYEKDHKGSKSALQVLSSRVKNLNQIKNDQLLISGREKEWIAQYGTDYNQKLLEYYTLKSNESNILIEQELYQIENYYRQLQTAQGRTSTNSKEEKSGLVAASNDAWSNVNVDQDLSKMSTEEKDISQEPSLQKAIQQASSWPHVPQQQANIQKEGSKEAQHENKAEWKVLDLSKVIKTQCSEPAAIERPKTSDDFQKELAFQILGQQYKIQTLLQEKKLIDDQVKRLKLQQVNRGKYSPPNSKQGHYITQHTNCANPTSRLSNKYEHQISNDESPFRPSHQGLESPATAQLSPELRHQFEPKMLHINLQQMDQSPLNDRSKVSPGVSKFSPREKQTELFLSLKLDEQSTLVIGGGATERGMKNQSKTIKKSESPKPRQSNRSKKDTSQINKDIQNILPGHTGGLLEAIAFEQLLAHGVEPVTPAPQMVEKQLLSISPPIESDEEMVVLVQTKRIAAAQVYNSAPETIHPLPTPSKENQDNHTNDKNRNTPGLIQVRDARDSTCLVPREKGSFESTYGVGSAVEVGQINNLPFQSQQMDLQQVLNTFDSNNSNEPSFARVQAIPTPNQKIKIKIEVSQERGNEMWTAEKPKDQDSGRNTGQSIIESIANSQKSTIVANPTQTISPSRLSNGKQFWPIKSKELSLTGNGIPQNLRSPRKLDNATQDKKVDEQIQTVDPTQRSQMRAIQVKQDSQRSQGRQDSQPSQGRYTSQSIGKDQPESQIPTSKNVAGIFQQIRNMDSRQVTYSRIVTQRNKDKFLLSKSTDAPQSTDRNGSPRQMEPQFAQESQRYRQPTIPQAQNRQPYNSQLQNIGNIIQVNSLMGQNLVEAETSGRNTRSFGPVAQISQHSPRSIMGEPHYRDKNRFLEELPEMIKRRQQEQLQKFKHFERRSQIEPNMKDLFNQFHEFQDSNNILRESNPMFEVAPTPKNPLTSKKMNQHINISIQGHQRNPTREGMSLGKVETIKFAHSNEKPWTVATAQPGHGRFKRVRGQLKPLDPINDLLSVSACFSTNNQRGTALSGPRKDLNNFERETRSHLEDRQRLEIGTELPFTPLARLGETSQGFYTSKPSGMRKSHQFGQLRQSNLFSSKQSPRNATAGLTAFQKSFGLQGISPRTGDAKSSLKDETFTRKNRIGVSQRREKNRAIKNQRNYAAKQIRPEQIAKGYRLSSRVMNTDKFNHHAQKMIIQHDQIMQQASLPVEQAENPSNSETNYEFKVNGRYQKIIKKGEKFETPQFPNDGQIKVVDQIQIGEAALGQNGINKLSDEFDTATAQNALSKNGLPVHHLQNNSVNKPIQTGDVTPEARSSVLLRPLPKLPQGLQDARVESQLGQSSGAPLDDAQGRPDVRRLLNTSNGCVESVKSEKGESLMDKEMLRAQQRTGVPGPRSRYGVNLESPSRILEADFKNEDIAQQLRDSPIMLDHGSAFSPSQTAQPTVKTVYTLHGGRKIEDQAAKQSRLESQLNNKSKPSIGPQDAQALSVSNGGSQSGASQAIGITKISQISHSVLAEQRALASRESKRYVTQQSQVVGRERQLPSNEASSLITNDNLRKLQCKSRDGARGFKHLGVFQDGASSRLKPANQDLPKEVQEQIQ